MYNFLGVTDREHNFFVYDQVKVFFKHTDFYGFVHQYNFLEWMSYAREAFFSNLFPAFSTNDSLKEISMVTIKANYDYYDDAKFGDDIQIVIFTENVRRISFDVIFEFYKKKSHAPLGVGRQTLVFLKRNSTRPAFIPQELLYEIQKGERKIAEAAESKRNIST